jgi:hypothetical protein
MGDNLEVEAAEAPPPPGTNKVEITIGGHTVIVESANSLDDVVGWALAIHDHTRDAAKKIPFGFDVSGGQFERAEPYIEPGLDRWEDENARRLGRQSAQSGTTRRLAVPDPPGHHRARLSPVQMDRGRAPVRRAGY